MSNALYEWSKKKNPNDSIGKKVAKGVVKTGQYMLDNPSAIVGTQAAIVATGVTAAKLHSPKPKKMGLTGASTQTLKGNINRHSALTKLYSGKYANPPHVSMSTKMKLQNPFGVSKHDKPKIDKELRNVSRYKRINKSSARYIAKTIPTNPVANISNKIFKTMGTVKSAVKGVLKIAPYALVGEIMKPKPAGQGSDLGKPIPKKYR